ncbi:light-harvesting complex-like protein OHP2 [Pycnococcus provasolii]
MASNVAAAKQRPAALKSNRRCPQRVQRNGTAPSFLCLAEAEARAVPAAASSGDDTPGGVTVEYQRKVAKELIQYFKEKEYEKQVLENQAFGWVKKAEISNGRWVMFGLLVGMMTEYATGKSFTDQVAITLTYMGFANFDV